MEKEWEKLEKVPAWQLTKVRNKKEVIDEARNQGKKGHFASLMDLCHLENSELEPQMQKYKGSYDMEGHAKKCVGSILRIGEQNNSNNSTKPQHHALTTTNSKKKKWDLLENCQKIAVRLFSNACIWPVLYSLLTYCSEMSFLGSHWST